MGEIMSIRCTLSNWKISSNSYGSQMPWLREGRRIGKPGGAERFSITLTSSVRDQKLAFGKFGVIGVGLSWNGQSH